MPNPDEGALAPALGPADAALLLPHLEPLTLTDGQRILEDGQRSDSLFVVVDGEVAVTVEADTGAVELGVRGPGAWLGEVGLLDGGPATATVTARGPARVLRLRKDELVRMTEEHPEVATVLLRHLTRQLAERIAATSSGIVERVGPGQVRVRKPEEVRGWASGLLGWLLGGAR